MKVIKVLLAITFVTIIIVSCLGEKKKNESALANSPQEKLYAVFDDSNNLVRPKDYRSWVFMGTASTPKSQDPNVIFPDFQNVYVDPVSFTYWKIHGEWREGTIIVKELLRQGDTVSSVGHGFFQGAHFEVAASVKDSKRFPTMHNGWNYFGFADFKKLKLNETSIPLGAQCAGCHNNNAIDGDVFYQYYPVMLAAKGYGDGNPENENTRPGLVEDYQHYKAIKEYIKNMKTQK
ncbi:MAG: cytochrome P460 family protein [Mucilaginibacter sp.]|uniref:cytochrome P460 family protein n=1 Tax=Mucilaginibacter sp. TaxID=1882438 RepID=UPI00326586AA